MGSITAFANQMDWGGLTSFVLRIVAIFFCIIVHEVSHGAAAYYLGDPTAKEHHRLSFNPIHHIDPFGLLMMIFVGFGWAKPVPVDSRYFKHPKSGMAITSLAGPVSNFILAYFAAILLYMDMAVLDVLSGNAFFLGLQDFLYMVVALSIGLGLFNLIPFPPLDGSKVLAAFLPDKYYWRLMQYERFGILVLMALLWTGVMNQWLYAALSWVMDLTLHGAWFAYPLMRALLRL